MRHTPALACLVAFALAACEPTPPGEIALTLTWADRPASTVWLSARVEARPPGAQPRILAEGERTPVEPGVPVELVLDAVPNGSHRVVVIEGRDADDPDLLPRYGGVSAPFTLRAGDTVEVRVPIALRPVDRPPSEAQVTLCFGEDCGAERVTSARLRAATIRTTTQGIASVQLANEPSFAGAETARVAVDDGRCAIDGETTRCAIPWDLTAGIDSQDGAVHRVFVRFEDEAGFDLPFRRAEVIRDDSAPLLLGATVSPEVVRPGEPATLIVEVSEPLDLAASGIVDGPALVRLGDRLTYSAELAPRAGQARVDLILADALGNRAEVVIEQGVVIDGIAPAFRLAALEPARLGAGDEQTPIAVRFTVDEAHPIDAPPQVAIGPHDAVVERDGAAFIARLADPGQAFAGSQGRYDVTARWTDRAGNAAGVTLGTIEIDFQPPSVTACALQPELAGGGQPVTYRVIASEPLAEARLAEPVEGFPVAAEIVDQTATWRALDGPGGSFLLAAVLVDAAGHVTEALCPLEGVRDPSPIDLSDAVTLSVWRDGVETTPYVGIDAQVRVEVRLPEPARQIAVALEGRPLEAREPGLFVGAPRDNAPDGPLVVRITVEDLAGNLSQRDETVIVDRTAPSVVTARLQWIERPAYLPSQRLRAVFAPADAVVTAVVRIDEPVEAQMLTDRRDPIPAGALEAGALRIPLPGMGREEVEEFVLEVIDRAGNRRLHEMGTVTWDATPPVVPAMRLVRAPWGSEATNGVPRTTIELMEPAEDGATIEIVRGRSDGVCDGDARLMRENEESEPALAAGVPGDLPYLCALARDRAGNPSAPTLIRQATWVATLGGEIPGDDLANPHRLVATPWLDPWRLVDRATPAGEEVARLDGARVEARGAWVWWRIGSDRSPDPADHLIVDPHRGALMVVTATGDGVLNPWTLKLAERGWSEATPSPSAPGDRQAAAVIYDRRRDRLLLFGGERGDVLNEAWTWSPDTERWRRLDEGVCGFGIQAVYDPLRDRIVLHGGSCQDAQDGRTVIWDPTTDTPHTPDGPQPAGRAGHAMAWDPVDGVVLLHGGYGDFGQTTYADLWAWDGETWAEWEADSPVGRRRDHQLAWDRVNDRLMLYAAAPIGEACAPVWERAPGPDGAWVERGGLTVCPGPGPMTWVGTLGRVVARDARGLWQWSGVEHRWQQLTPSFAERPTAGAASMHLDPHAEALFLAEGQGLDERRLYTLSLETGVWRQTDTLPAAGPLGWSPAHGLIQEGDGGPWRRDAPDAWSPLDLPGAPPASSRAVLVTRANQDLLRLGAMGEQAALWRLDAQWSLLEPAAQAGPLRPSQTTAAWFHPADQLLVFGIERDGDPTAGQRWTWQPDTGWAALPADEGPDPSLGARLTWVPDRDRLALFGGYRPGPRVGGDPLPVFDELWEWDGATWHAAPRSSPWPDPRYAQAFGYDRNRSRLLMYGGSGAAALNDYWEGAIAQGRPALRLDLRLAAAGVPVEAIERLVVIAHAGGARGDNGAPGARLQAWVDGQWIQQVANRAGPDAPAPLTWVADDPAIIARLPVGARQTVSVTLTPRGVNAQGIARVAADYVEARIDYRVP